MYTLIVFLPLIGFISGILFGQYLGLGVTLITTFCVFLSAVFSVFLLFYLIKTGVTIKVVLGSWISTDSLNVEWSFYFDSLTVVMLVIVTVISSLVHLYSTEYMNQDPHLSRFMSYLSLFTFFMLILVTSNNLLQMFVGWEGVGVSSYLLINFWFTRIQANKSAIKAMLVNKVGDFFILLGMFFVFFIFGSLDYDVIFGLSQEIRSSYLIVANTSVSILDCICLCLFLGAMGKSAQVGLHIWLPDAMEGPTPVSALIHAATMVTAGVFLVIRCSYLFELSTISLDIAVLVGSLTSLFAATTGAFQNDLKKVIAYSTCSQLGYMIFACGVSSYDVAAFHLFNHAFFKALLFLGAGAIIHSFEASEQDIRKLGGLLQVLPLSYAVGVIGSLALIGFPFLSGFYSKDIILETALAKYSLSGHFSYFFGCFAAFFTAFYSTKLLFLPFLANPNGNRVSLTNTHESSWRMSFPLFFLSLLSIFIGFFTKDLLIGPGTFFWGSAIFILPENYRISDIEFISLTYKLLPLTFVLLGVYSSFRLYSFDIVKFFEIKKLRYFRFIYYFFNRKWYFDRFYNDIISKNLLYYSYEFSYKDVDRGVLEVVGPYGLTKFLEDSTNVLKVQHSGNIFHYLYLFSVFIVIIIYVFTFIGIFTF